VVHYSRYSMSRPSTTALAVSGRSGRLAPRIRQASWPAVGVVCLVLLSVAVGRDVAAAGDESRLGAVLIGVGAVCGGAILVAIGPVLCLAAVGGLAAAGWLPVLGQFGGVDLTLADVFYVGAVAGWASETLREGPNAARPGGAPSLVPQLPIVLFLAFAGISLAHVQAVDPGQLDDSFISWVRLVQTASLGWLAAAVIRTKTDVTVVLAGIALGGTIAVALSLESAISGGGNPLVERYSATFDPNALGLVSGLLVLLALFAGVTRHSGPRMLLAATGIVGLLLAKSVGAFIATGLAMALGASLATGRSQIERATHFVVALAVAGVLVFGLVQFLRPSSNPADPGFRESSASQRIIVGAAGLEVFERNPVIGAGWRRSDSPTVIGDAEIASELRSRFAGAKQEFFPDVSPSSVHNAYVQILADLGLVGFALLAAAVASIGLGVARVLRRQRDRGLWSQTSCASLGLVLILVWLNDNPLYGGQVETILLALLVGIVAAIGRQAPGDGRMGPPQAAAGAARPSACRGDRGKRGP
jgi:O-antigen ligase